MLNLKMLNRKRGFTLIELLVVMVIISILSSISYASYKGYHKRARAYAAKKDLSAIVSIAEVFYSNAGFYMPNLREMHIPIKGRHSYNYQVICHKDGSLANAIFGPSSDTCGDFEINKTSDTPPQLNVTDSCADASTKCWMGAALCHSYEADNTISCEAENYTFNFKNRGVLQWKSPTEDWTDDAAIKAELTDRFKIVDFTDSSRCERVSIKDDTLTETSHCFMNKEYAVKSDRVAEVIKAHWGTDDDDKKKYISSPSKLVVTAVACKERQDDCTDTSPGGHSVIRMDTNRLVEEL